MEVHPVLFASLFFVLVSNSLRFTFGLNYYYLFFLFFFFFFSFFFLFFNKVQKSKDGKLLAAIDIFSIRDCNRNRTTVRTVHKHAPRCVEFRVIAHTVILLTLSAMDYVRPCK